MGHNITDRKLAEIRARNAADARRGWLIDSAGRANEVSTPFGLLARKAVLHGGCSRHPTCSRRVVFDARAWCEQGMGEMPIFELQRSYACGLVGCQMRWRQESYPDGLPLAAFLHRPEASVSVACLSCQRPGRRFAIADFIAQISAAGTGGLATSTTTLSAAIIRGDCPRCGRREWAVNFWCGPPKSGP